MKTCAVLVGVATLVLLNEVEAHDVGPRAQDVKRILTFFDEDDTTVKHEKDKRSKTKAAAASAVPKPVKDDLVQPANDFANLIFVDHSFYESALFCNKTYFKKHWMNITSANNRIIVHPTLSNVALQHAYRDYSLRIELPFEFPFYGHLVRTITVSTEGYVYTGSSGEHGFQAEQHIAPLMANFDLSIDDSSVVVLYEEASRVTIVWQNMTIRLAPYEKFTFALTIHKNGDFFFSYKDIPIRIQDLDDDTYSVFVGLADSYILNGVTNYIRLKTLHNYSRIPFNMYNIESNSILYLIALPSCPMHNSCTTCTGHEAKYGTFKCEWCESMRKCTSGADFYRPYKSEYHFIKSCNETEDIENVEEEDSEKRSHPGFFAYVI